MKFLQWMLFLFFLPLNGLAQSIIEGKVLDAETEEPLAYAHVRIVDTNYGTVANEDGLFSLSVGSLPSSLSISYIGYEPLRVHVQNEGEITARLTPSVITADEFVIMDDYELNIINQAIENILTDKNRLFGNAFYRQVSRVDTIYTEFIETFYGAELSANNVEQWKVESGRYAVIPPDSVMLSWTNRNFSILSRRPFVQATSYNGTAIWPLRRDAGEFYDFFFKESYITTEDTLLVFQIEPKPDIQHSLFEGTVIIAENDYSIREIDVSQSQPNYTLTKLNRRDRVEDDMLKIRMEMAETDEGIYVPRLIEHSFEAKYIARKGMWPFRRTDFELEFSTASTLLYFDYDLLDNSLVSEASFFEGLDTDQNDYTLIDQTDYDPEFWKDNPIIRRTPVEESIIESFERYGSFGRMFEEEY